MVLLSSCYQGENLSPNISFDSPVFVSGTEGEDAVIVENPFVLTAEENTSTFSIDADGGAYANVRRYLEQDGTLPPPAAIRTEELINYFDLDYPFNNTGHPIYMNGEISGCPWSESNRLVRIGIEGESISQQELPFSNFVFLIDVSGSMASSDKLELIKAGMDRFVDQMRDPDHLSIVTYAGSTRVHLRSTSGREKDDIRRAIDRLNTGGGTNGGAGINLAYDEAAENFIPGGNNRIFIATDGDFNVGITDFDELIALIEEKREGGVFLTTLGVGRDNYSEQTLEQIANKGNGTYEYLDKVEQLEKVFFQETSKFYTVAKDVKVQVVFNAELVKAYRLIGYENRVLANEDFEDDTEDAGEIGAGQNITALYEIIPIADIDARSTPSFTIDFRYKLPDSDTSVPLSLDITDQGNDFATASDYSQFTTSVAAFGLILLNSQYKGTADYDDVLQWLGEVDLEDSHGWKAEFRELVELARGM
jgi:Ca-activated chloride channel family protein